MDKNCEKVCAWLSEVEDDYALFDSDDTDADSDFCIENVASDSDESTDQTTSNVRRRSHSLSGENITIFSEPEFFLGKDKITKWYKNNPPSNVRTRRHNIVLHLPGVKRIARDAKSVLDCWKLFFPDTVVIDIVECTNKYLAKIRANYQNNKNVRDTTKEEIDALLGLLYLAGYLRSNHLNLHDLWRTDGFSPEYFRAVMSEKRFSLLLRAVRFDDIETRNVRRAIDKLAPIRAVFDDFVRRCKENYTVGENCTIDEMLEGFRGRCSFRQYIPNKPNKYGIKIQALVDSRTFYTSNMEVYVGTQPDGPFKCDNSPSSIVKRLIAPISKTGRNITMDNWYNSIPLANELLKNHNLTVVGTLRKNKREIPPVFLETKKREVNSTLFGYGKDLLLTSYTPNKNKNVIMISSMHDQGIIDPESGDQKKPEVITYYNGTKGGVDVVDEMKGEYSVARISCRWPLTIFFSLMNIAGINSQIIYRENTDKMITRREYLKTLGQELTKPYMVKRLEQPCLSFLLRQQIIKMTGCTSKNNKESPNPDVSTSDQRIRCNFCPIRKNRFTKVPL